MAASSAGLSALLSSALWQAAANPLRPSLWQSPAFWGVLALPIASAWAAFRLADTARTRSKPAPKRPLADSPSGSSARGRILLVDDNAVNRRVAHLMLTKAGYQVLEARDGREACDLALAGHYDLILMDVQMPHCSGYEATREIRARQRGVRTPILAMTARPMDVDVQDCLRAGMDGYVSKPVREPALLAAVESWMTAPTQPTVLAEERRAANSGERPALAPAALAELRAYGGDGDDSIVVELATLFFRGAAEHLNVMRQALADRDPARFERAAHTLKGSSGTLGARQLEARCRVLEDNARNGRLPQDAATVDELADMVAIVRRQLELEFKIQLPQELAIPSA